MNPPSGQMNGEKFLIIGYLMEKKQEDDMHADHNFDSHAAIVAGGCEQSRMQTALALAAGFECQTRPACGTCPACRKVYARIHPDVLWVEPEGREIVVDDIRRLRKELFLVPNEGARRVVIISQAERLNEHAQNALLSLLEEPPAQGAFVLCLPAPEALLATIRSRCQLLSLPPEPEEEEARWRDEAAALWDAWLKGDEWETARLCLSLEKTGREDFSLFLGALLSQGVRRMERMEGAPLTARAMCRIMDIMFFCQNALEGNAGVGTVCGALAAGLGRMMPSRRS